MAIPGRPDDSLSHGCNRLIREGAGLCTCGADVMAQLGIDIETSEAKGRNDSKGEQSDKKGHAGGAFCNLTVEEQQVLACLSAEPKHIDRISSDTGVPVSKLTGILVRLELKGCIRRLTAGQYQCLK